jgi:hypothetical protein
MINFKPAEYVLETKATDKVENVAIAVINPVLNLGQL